jgi:hypothetical protein
MPHGVAGRGDRDGFAHRPALAAWLWRRHRDDGGAALGAITGTVLALMLLVVETISLHRVDAVMYAEAGPLVLLAWAWVGAAAIVIASALASSPDRSRSRRHSGTRGGSRWLGRCRRPSAGRS